MNYAEDDLLPLSGIQHFAYCPRQWALIHVEQQWLENLGTAEGRLVHHRVDDPYYNESRGHLRVERAIPLVSKTLGLYGVADLMEIVEKDDDNTKSYHLVEYKRGKPKVDDRDQVQLCAQAICIEEMREVKLHYGYFFYDMVKHRQKVEFTELLRAQVKELSDAMHYYFRNGITPVLKKSSKCRNCSLFDICMPKLEKLKGKANKFITNYFSELRSEE